VMLTDLPATKTNHSQNLASNCGKERMRVGLML
jgi:hypothetical protein